MATMVAGSAMAGGGGFVLKSVRGGNLGKDYETTFSVQNEGDFCVITKDDKDHEYSFVVSKIDDIHVNFQTGSSLIFGKNIVVKSGRYPVDYQIYEYGPAE